MITAALAKQSWSDASHMRFCFHMAWNGSPALAELCMQKASAPRRALPCSILHKLCLISLVRLELHMKYLVSSQVMYEVMSLVATYAGAKQTQATRVGLLSWLMGAVLCRGSLWNNCWFMDSIICLRVEEPVQRYVVAYCLFRVNGWRRV